MKDLNIQAMKIIKNKAKSLGLTQNDLAIRINVSLPTIKRWYGGGTITLESLHTLVSEVGLTLTEVFSSIENAVSEYFHYTEEQELFFSTHLNYLAYFDNILRGLSPIQIQRKFKLTEKKNILYLSKLDKLKLIEWLPKNKVNLLVQGEPAWEANGLLATKQRNDIFKSFIDAQKESGTYFYLHDYLPEDSEMIKIKIEELLEFAKRANSRAKFHIDESSPSGLYISLQNFRWDIDRYLS